MVFWENMRTDSESYRQGEELFRRGSVHPAAGRTDALCYDVGSTPPQRVCLLASGAAECTGGQDQEPCCHVAAAALAALRESDKAISYNVSPETCIDAMLFEVREVLYGSSRAH